MPQLKGSVTPSVAAAAPMNEIKPDLIAAWKREQGLAQAKAAADRVMAAMRKGTPLATALAAEKKPFPTPDKVAMNRQQLAGGFLGAPVHRRIVDHGAPRLEQLVHHGGQQLVSVAAGLDIEPAIRAEANHRQRFAGGWNVSGEHVPFSWVTGR